MMLGDTINGSKFKVQVRWTPSVNYIESQF
jgi:hypothetical protein